MTTTRRHARIRDMYRIRQILKLIYNYPLQENFSQGEFLVLNADGISERDFKAYLLLNVNFNEDFRSRIKMLIRVYLKIDLKTSKSETKRYNKRWQRIDTLIAECKKKEYLKDVGGGKFKITETGIGFSQSLGFIYLNECFKQYPIWAVFFGSLTIIGVGQTLFKFLWPLVKPWIKMQLGI